MNCVNCGASIPEIGASTCPNCGEALPAESSSWESPLFLDDHMGGVIHLDDHRPDDSVDEGMLLASEEEEALAEAFDEEAPERHPSNSERHVCSIRSERNYYRLVAYFGGKREEFWVQASTDGVARTILREYGRLKQWKLVPAPGQPPFPSFESSKRQYHAAKDAAIEVDQISHDVPRKFIFRETSKSDPVMVEL